MPEPAPIHYEGVYCDLSVEAPAPGMVVVTFAGHDIGEFGAFPMQAVEQHLAGEETELYIDARHTRAASVEVSGDWALWLGAHRDRFAHVSMLTGSRFIEVTAGFVRSFSELEDVMRLYTDADAFDEALARSVAARR